MFARKKNEKTYKGGSSQLQNSVKTVVANIRFASVDDPVHTIAVTSSIPGEGKTTVSIALGQAFAAGGKDVIVIDCDLRRRSIAKAVGVHAKYGLYSVLANQASLNEAVVATDTPNLYILDVEPHIPNPVDVLASKRFGNLVERLRKEYAYVIIDTPPLTAFVDAAVISQVTDATLLVVREGYVKRKDVLAAYDQLEKADANVIGAVMNCCDVEHTGYYYYNYYSKSEKNAIADPAPQAKLIDPSAARGSHASVVEDDVFAANLDEVSDADATGVNMPIAKDAGDSGLKPLPDVDYESPADSTMAFLAQTGYSPKSSSLDD